MTDAVSTEVAAPLVVAQPPIAAPVAAPAPAPVASPVTLEAPAAPTVVTYEPTGHPGLDLTLSFIGGLGIDPSDPAMVAADADGDFSMLKAKLATMGDKARGWEQYVAIAEKAHADSAVANEALVGQTKALLHTVVGGEENWKAIQAFSAANATDQERSDINAMLLAGGTQARAAALMLQTAYAAKGNYAPADPARHDASQNRAPPSAGAPLTRREATAEVNALVRRFGSANIDQRPEYKQIWARVAR